MLPYSPNGSLKSDFFSRGHLVKLLPALMHSTAAHPRVHSVWSVITPKLQECARAQPGTVSAFWDVVEQNLFTSSHERKYALHTRMLGDAALCAEWRQFSRRYLGFQLFAMLLPGLPANEVPSLFSTNFMRCLVNNVGKEHTMLHSVASKCLSDVR